MIEEPDAPELQEELPPGDGCLLRLLRALLRLGVTLFALLVAGSLLGVFPDDVLAITRPPLLALFELFGIRLGPPLCADPTVRETLPHCFLAR